jgi:hypothetical protein
MGVQDGQDVSAAITNPAFINKNIDDTTPSRLGLGSTVTAQGPSITWAQQQFNSICSALGLSINQAYNYLFTWTNNYVGTSTDSVFARVQALVALFSGSTGHTHSGVDGQGPQIVASTLASVPYKGYGIQGTNYTSTAANSDVVTSLLTGLPVSTSPTVLGVVSTTPYNKTILRNSTTGDDFKDTLGNTVYGRLTFSSTVWTHSYYSVIAGTETAYTFLATSPIEWFFQQIYNPMNGAPTYDPGFVVPSANATADIVTATTTVQGKTQLATASPLAIGTASVGTQNATVANADHVHPFPTQSTATVLANVSGSTAIPTPLSLVSAPTPTTAMLRDTNGNVAANNFDDSFASTATAAGTTTLTVASAGLQQFTGTLAQNCVLPAANTLPQTGFDFIIMNRSTGVVTVKDGSGTILQAMAGNTQLTVTCANIGSTAGVWDLAYTGGVSGGGAGGTSLRWVEDVSAPSPADEFFNLCYFFVAAQTQYLFSLLKVPTSYVAGSPIKLKLPIYSPDSTGTILVTSLATLIRNGTDAFGSTTNQRTSTNTAITLSGGTVNVPQTEVLDLTDSTGKINSVAVSAGDYILIQLNRGSDTGLSDVRSPVYGSEVTFS